ncbi:hypothetical protein GS597_18980 [Synechococcales cyanobacterium C]|uniref:Uncharacterized protein n=1 Tax=Petrachloros mirabilis ULC683 TaxID=2781853 RepID=A0A8K2A9Y4_9CYAN|nr:hypothetical protein [Petrachloros mirabilis]NCJ08555.1 hypothetical protein [Petrachloros mirabilis ULC683]
MGYFRPVIFIVVLFFFTIVLCALTSLVAIANPLLLLLGIAGGMLLTLLALDLLDTAFPH